MSKRTYLVLDMNYLSWRAMYAMKGLTHETIPTGVSFGIFRDIIAFQDFHATRDIVFCWDYGKVKRREELFPAYKKKRKEAHALPEKKLEYKALQKQIRQMREDYLPHIGYENLFYQDGYEADDVIASVAYTLKKKHEVIIISADKDLYQLLDADKVLMWNPKTKAFYTEALFEVEFKNLPLAWPSIKAIAGCPTDEIPGIPGVGEKTAAKYTCGECISDKITDWVDSTQYAKNLKLVTLPYKGTKKFVVLNDNVDAHNWNSIMEKLGMKSLIGQCPKPIRGS